MGGLTAPVEKMMERVEWRELPDPEEEIAPGGLYATHEGILEIGAARLRCYTLNGGQRVFDADSVAAFFAPPLIPDGRSEDERTAA